jgi:hypothetical protein
MVPKERVFVMLTMHLQHLDRRGIKWEQRAKVKYIQEGAITQSISILLVMTNIGGKIFHLEQEEGTITGQ